MLFCLYNGCYQPSEIFQEMLETYVRTTSLYGGGCSCRERWTIWRSYVRTPIQLFYCGLLWTFLDQMRIGDTSIYFKFVSVKTNIKVGGGLGLLDQELLDCFLATILG